MNQLLPDQRRRLPSRFLLAVVGLVQLSCFAEPATQAPGAGAEGGGGASDGASAGVGGEASPGAAEPAKLGLLHGAPNRMELAWRLSRDGSSVADAALLFRGVERLTDLAPGSYLLELTSDGEQREQELELTPGSELNVVVTPDADDPDGWQMHVLSTETSDEASSDDAPAARLFVVHAAQGGTRALDVGNDGSVETAVEASQASSQQPLDVTRPALALLDDATVTATFTLPQPDKDSSVIAVLLGDPLADGLASSGERLVVARMDADEEASEIRPDPVLYFLHASGVHAGLDLFIGRGNPIKTSISTATGSVDVAAFLPDTSVNQRRVLAEVVDNARFGDLRVGRVPPSPATLELYLTIPSDPQVPAGLNYNLVGDLLPNQRLRNGPAIGRQGGQTVDGELQAGAEYLLVAPSFGLFDSNHLAAGAPKAPLFPFERLSREAPPAGQFSLRVAASVKAANITQTTSLDVDGSSVLKGAPRYDPTDPQLLEAGVHQLAARVGDARAGSLALEAEEGQELLVVLAGDAAPAPVVAPGAQRPDDTDGDGAVCSEFDLETSRFVDPNYLPPDGNSLLIQDDCPDAPGSLAHQGCPASPLTWLIVDVSKRPPTLRTVPLTE